MLSRRGAGKWSSRLEHTLRPSSRPSYYPSSVSAQPLRPCSLEPVLEEVEHGKLVPRHDVRVRPSLNLGPSLGQSCIQDAIHRRVLGSVMALAGDLQCLGYCNLLGGRCEGLLVARRRALRWVAAAHAALRVVQWCTGGGRREGQGDVEGPCRYRGRDAACERKALSTAVWGGKGD